MSIGLSMYDGLENENTSDNSLENSGGTTKKLARGISRATENAAIVSYARSQLAALGALDTPEFTFSLPDLSVYPGTFMCLNVSCVYLLFQMPLIMFCR